jgi:hypothetical protein
MKPTVSRLQQEFKDKIEFRSLNIDDPKNDAAKKQYKFVGQPQFVILSSDGAVTASRNGMQTYETLKRDLEAQIAKN